MEEYATVNIAVTREHIDKGVAGDCDKCAVALAIEEAVPGSKPEVFGNVIYLGMSVLGMSVFIDTPDVVYDFINDFDNGNYVQPITFPLDIPTRLLAQGSHA